MTIYIFVLLSVILLDRLLNNKKIDNKFFIITSFTILAVPLSLRGETVGEDTSHYLDVFHCVSNLSWKTILTSGFDVVYAIVYGANLKIETGFAILNKLIGSFTDNGQWMIAIVSILTCALFGRFILMTFDDVSLPTFTFLCGSLYMESYNIARQLLAMAIAIQAYKHLKEKSYFKVFVILFIAILIHKTAIVLLITVPLMHVNNYNRGLKVLFVVGIGVFVMHPFIFKLISLLIPRYSAYLTTNYWGFSFHGIIILWVIELVLCILLIHNQITSNEAFLTITFVFLYILCQIVGMNISVFQRIGLYFNIASLSLFPLGTSLFVETSRSYYKLGIYVALSGLYISYALSESRQFIFFWQ